MGKRVKKILGKTLLLDNFHYISILDTRCSIKIMNNFSGDEDSDTGDKLKQQQKEAARRENTLVHRLTTKEQELQDFMVCPAAGS